MATRRFPIATFGLLLLCAGAFGMSSACNNDDNNDPGAGTCDQGLTPCGDICVDTQSSAAHCGACDNACDADEACDAGSCAPATPAECESDQTRCGDLCVNTDSNTAHCGDCDSPCADDEMCSSGSCENRCPDTLDWCGDDGCVDLEANRDHCGDCDTSCNAGQHCSNGTCNDLGVICTPGHTHCGANCCDDASETCDPSTNTCITAPDCENDEFACGTGCCEAGAEFCNSNHVCQQAFCPINSTACYGRRTAKCCGAGLICNNTDLDNPVCGFIGTICGRDEFRCGSGDSASCCSSNSQICDSSGREPVCRLVLCAFPKFGCVNNDRTAATCCNPGELCNRIGDTPTCQPRVIIP